MQQNDRFTVINIREYLKNYGDADQLCEDELKQILAEFSCSKNQDVEYFLKTQAIDFTKKNQLGEWLFFLKQMMKKSYCHFIEITDFYLSTKEYRKKKTWNRMNLYSF